MSDRLSTKEHWSERWSDQAADAVEQDITFDTQRLEWRAVHRFICKHLPRDPSLRALEIGCYPGRYMWYLHDTFGYTVDGIEYVDWCAEVTSELLARAGVPGEVMHADMFEVEADERYDVVSSFGLVEHFEDTVNVVNKHLDMLKPGGLLLLIIPNHAGLNGHVMKRVNLEVYDIHNRMSYAELERGVRGTGRADVLDGGYFGGLSLTNTMLYTRANEHSRLAYLATRGPGYLLERTVGRVLPETRFFSPMSAIVARKRHS